MVVGQRRLQPPLLHMAQPLKWRSALTVANTPKQRQRVLPNVDQQRSAFIDGRLQVIHVHRQWVGIALAGVAGQTMEPLDQGHWPRIKVTLDQHVHRGHQPIVPGHAVLGGD